MNWIKQLFSRRRIYHDLSEEIQEHLEEEIDELVASGMSREEATHAARRNFGNATLIEERGREVWQWPSMDSLVADIRYALRMLRKDRSFTVVAVFTLAVGIAVNTAVFTAFDVTLRPIQATDPGRIVSIHRSSLQEENVWNFNYPDYLYYRAHNQVFEDLFAAAGTEVSLSDAPNANGRSQVAGGITAAIGIRFFQQMAGTAELGWAAMVSQNYFSTLGISPAVGRSFATGDSYPEVLLSYNFWARRFESDPSVLGKTLKLNGKPFTVIGITPKDFIGTYQNSPSVWLPISAYPLLESGHDPLHNTNDECCAVYGRLKADVSRHQAQADLTVLAEQLRRTYPSGSRNSKPVTISVVPASPFGEHLSRDAFAMVVSLMSAVALVLLIACANVAGLQLARSAARQKEIGVRLALGASRGRLMQQLLTEASILAVMAGGAGLVASWFAERFLVRSVAAALPPEWGFLAINVNPDVRVFGYTLAVSLVTGIMFGLTPALEASRSSVTSVLKEEGASFAGKLRGLRLRHFFIAAQMAICLLLLIAAGLLARGSAQAVRLNPGFETKSILGLDIEVPPGLGYDASKRAAVVRQVVDRLQTVPGVKEVAQGRVPLAGGLRTASVSLDASSKQSNTPEPTFYYSYVTPNYFDTLSIPLVRGRTFSEAEARAGARVTIISEATARRLLADQEAIGKRVTLDASKQFHQSDEPFPSGQSFQVIGVSRDIRSAWLNEIDPGAFYLPLSPDREGDVMVRAQADPSALITTLGEQVKAVDPKVVAYAETLDGLITMNPGFVLSRVGAVFSAIIGLLGLVLASVGVYGMVSYAVVQRTHEIGIRMALGARRSGVLALILLQSARPVGAGLLAGLALSVLVSRLLSSLLFGISAFDPLAFGGVSLFLMTVALLACYVPARRATNVDPMVALRYE
jgi:putative ABC transport system permease protein